MATIKAINSRASIGKAINYVTKEDKTEDKLITGKDCDPYHAIDDMKATKELFGKTGGREYKHYVISYHEKEDITPQKAHELACKLAEKKFKDYECIIATHTDKGHTHTHIIVNSVNFRTGEKFRQSREWLQQLKNYSDNLCRENGLTVTEKGKTFEGQQREDMTAYSKDKYNVIERASKGETKSYVLDTALAVEECKEKATSREDFITKMNDKGYDVTWADNRKYIVFTDKEGHKVRNSNLEKTFHADYSKGGLESEFAENKARAERTEVFRHRIDGAVRKTEQSDRGTGADHTKQRIDNIRTAETNRRIADIERKRSETERELNRKEPSEEIRRIPSHYFEPEEKEQRPDRESGTHER